MKYKPLLMPMILLGLHSTSFGQNVGIGTNTPHPSAQLEISSPHQGFLLPRMTDGALFSISQPAHGLMVYDSTVNSLMVNFGTPARPDWENIALNNGWNLTGNLGTDPFNQFIGTTTNTNFGLLMNGQRSGLIDSAKSNTFLGYKAGFATTGTDNSAVGAYALLNNTTGSNNTALGAHSLQSNTTGSNNTAIGVAALFDNVAGVNNTAIGSDALGFNTGDNNIAIGVEALLNNLGAPGNTVSGTQNVAVGSFALENTTNASFNTAVGYSAGANNALGFNNVLIGANNNIAKDDFNDIAVGQGITINGVSTARFGNSATTSIGGFANWSNISDERVKKDMKEDVKGTEFIMRLRPLTYHLNLTGADTTTYTGFVAQEVEKAAQETGYDFSGVDKPTEDAGYYGLRYASFVVPLVKTIQEQQQFIKELSERLNTLKKQIKN